MLIRRAVAADLPQVNELQIDVADMHRRARPDMFKECDASAKRRTTLASAKEMLDDNQKDIFVCDCDGVIAGFACVDYVIRPETSWIPEQRYCYIKEFGVSKAFRRQGIGKALLGFIRDEALRREIHRLELDVWAFNDAAVCLYESFGFKPRYSYMELDFK